MLKGLVRRGYWRMLWGTIVMLAIAIGQPLLGLTIDPPTTNSTAPAREIRGVWITNIDSNVLFQRQRLRQGIEDLHKLNFNTLYPVVWNWGYTLYPSQVAKRVMGKEIMPRATAEGLLQARFTRDEGLEGRDILRETIDAARQRKMAVIPWVEFGFMGTAPSDPLGSNLAKLHPDWLLKKRDGKTVWQEGRDHERVWFNPLHPQVQKFTTDLAVEIVSKYRVDGIQFDDHFGYPSEFGYDDFTVKLYKKEHGGQEPPADAKNEAWIQWRADKITAYLETLFKAVKKANPRAIISMSPNPYSFAKRAFLQDWVKWERRGLVEELVIQVYRDRLDRFTAEIEQPEIKQAKTHIPVAIGVLSGIKPRPIPMSQIQAQVATIRQKGLAGVSFFFYESLWELSGETPRFRQDGFRQLFPQPATRT
jgi:uncharacterized lipoprotein YddW (UPF0748 family)